jgi:RHS repeat-associated protein
MNGTCTGGTVLETTSFLYDGDGNLVKKTKPDGSKTIYVGGIYEVDKTSGGSVTRTVTYYPAAGAMRINISGGSNSVYYILKDHLGSASVVTDASGNIVGENRYYPYGETRFTSGTLYTDKLFTGQRDVGLGIYHYGARFYSPRVGRFISPDTIVPGAANPQAWNRYSYVLGNPLKYIDPSGHGQCQTQEDCDDMGTTPMGTGSNNTPTPKPKDEDEDDGAYGNCNNDPDCLIDDSLPPGWSTGVYCDASGCHTDGFSYADYWHDPLSYIEMLILGGGSYRALVNFATINGGSSIVSIGSNGLYQKAGYTFFQLPDKVYRILNAVGLSRLINTSVMANQIAQEKPVIITLLNPAKPGAGTQMEITMLKAAQYIESTANWLGVTNIWQPSTWTWLE